MPIEVIATTNAADANSFITLAEYAYYWERRLPLDPVTTLTGDVAARNVIMATRVLSMMVTAKKVIRWDQNGDPYYYTSRAWTGEISTSTQALPWGRTGMYDRLGRAIASNVIPQELKDATSELAGQLELSDRTLDSDIIVQGITSVKAGSVALTFKENIAAQVLPDAVINLMPNSWFTDELIDYGIRESFLEV